MKNIFKQFGATIGMIVAVALALLTATPAWAQAPQTVPLLSDGITSITVSNGIPYTNIVSKTSFGTNIVGLGWTTASGSNVTASATNGTITRLTRSGSIWAESNGNCPTNANLSLTFTCGAGNNGTTNFIDFVPLYDGTNESTETGDLFRWVVTSAGAVTNTIHTNNPLSRWPGSQRFRVREIVAGTNAAASQFTVLGLNLNGFPR